MEPVWAERAAEEGGAGAGVRGLGPRERLLVGREAGGGQVGGVAVILIIFLLILNEIDGIHIKAEKSIGKQKYFVPQYTNNNN